MIQKTISLSIEFSEDPEDQMNLQLGLTNKDRERFGSIAEESERIAALQAHLAQKLLFVAAQVIAIKGKTDETNNA